MKKNIVFIIFCLFCAALLTRFYSLMWGNMFFFHPDERNIAYSIIQLSFPKQMNPHFFAYGSLPIYVIYFSALSANLFKSTTIPLSQAIMWSRIYCAFFSTFLVLSLFLIGKKLYGKQVGIIALLLSAGSVGLIQFAHFGTFEMWLTFFSLWLFYTTVQIYKKKTLNWIILSGILTSILVGIKISSIVLVLPPIATIFFTILHSSKNWKKKIRNFLFSVIIFLFFGGIIYIGTNPFVLLDTNSFLGSIHYESSVALGTLPVFYTGEFYNTIPVIFQFIHVYPFLLNPFFTIIFIFSFVYLLIKSIYTKSPSHLLLITYYLLLFFSVAFFFVKWTRYVIPTLPFIYLSIAIFLNNIGKSIAWKMWYKILICLFFFLEFIFAFSYMYVVFFLPDTRVTAAEWAYSHIPQNSQIAVESYDLGFLPFNSYFPKLNFVDFYNENNITNWQQLPLILSNTDYLILPSQRIMKIRLTNNKQFPKGNIFYSSLFSGRLGYKEIYQTPCNFWCSVIYSGNPIFSLEETANVFDRPTVFIFKNNARFSENEYAKLLDIK